VLEMKSHADKTNINHKTSVANRVESTSQFIENRQTPVKIQKMQELLNDSPRVKQLAAFGESANHRQNHDAMTSGDLHAESGHGVSVQCIVAPPAQRRDVVGAQGTVIQAVWASVNNSEERLNLQDDGDGTYTHSRSGRRFERVGTGNPLIVAEIGGRNRADDRSRSRSPRRERRPRGTRADDREHEHQSEREQNNRRRPAQEDLERPTNRQRLESPEDRRIQVEEPHSEQDRLTADEFGQIDRAQTYRFGPRRTERPLYGAENADFRGRACWNWALTGARGDAINPSHLFEMLGDQMHNRGGAYHGMTFEQSWRQFVPQAEETQTAEQQRMANRHQEVYGQHQDPIRALWERRRAMNGGRGRGRAPSANPDNIESITNDAVRLAMQMNNLQPAEENEGTPFSIAMARHPDEGVNWSHWGVEVNNHSFETIPDSGLWHQREGFEHWANQTESIEDSQVTRVPLRGLNPGHLAGIRGLLGIMGGTNSSRGTNTSGGRGRSTRQRGTQASTTSSGGDDAGLVPVVAAGHDLDAGGMVLHYHGVIAWANARGTYSPEFLWVRDNPALARHLLVQGGMTAVAAQTFTDAFAQELHNLAGHVAYDVAHAYVQPGDQQAVMTALGAQEQLFAIIRYLQHAQGQHGANQRR
jgi:hypothetical protein